MTVTAKFLWLIVRHSLSPKAVYNVVTWKRAVLMVVMITRFEVDLSWLLQVFMHEKAFKVTTTYPFLCMIFSLCLSVGVPMWHINQLKTPLGAVDFCLIRDKANELSPCRGPRKKLPPLG